MKKVFQDNRHARCTSGFTLVELMVASVIMTTCLLGVYSLATGPLNASHEINQRAEKRAAAASIVATFANALEHAVIIKSMPSISSDIDSQGNRVIICVIDCGPASNPAGLRQQQYTWSNSETAAGTNQTFTIQRRERPMSGTKEISPIPPANNNSNWNSITATTIGQDLTGITVRFKSLTNAGADWNDTWSGQSGTVAIQITVQVGNEIVQKIVVPNVNTPFGSQQQS